MILLQFRCKLLSEPHHLFYTCAAACPVLSNILAFSRILQIYLQAEMRTRICLHKKVTQLSRCFFHITAITQRQNVHKLIALSSGSEHLAGCKSPSILLLAAVNKHVECTLSCDYY